MDRPTPEATTSIEEYVQANREHYTRDAMRASLVEAGHDPAQVDAALDAALDAAASSVGGSTPTSSWATQNPRLITAALVVAAYGGMWLLFALLTNWNAPGYVTFTTWVFGGVLGVFGLASLIYVGVTDRLTTGGQAAIVGAMVIPLVMLLVLAGLCVPFTRFR